MRDIDRKIIGEAQSWLGTPYRHQGARKQIGCDCLGLIRGVWAQVYETEPEVPKPYSQDWAEQALDEPMLIAARKYCGAELPIQDLHKGCLVLFRWQAGSAIKHAGILSESNKFIHAYERISVTQSSLVPSWRRRIAAIFEFPSI
jgi:NlpC/P60 family putative phage cell wall peptidase